MYLEALATAVPERAYTQRDCWGIIERSGVLSQLRERSAFILRKVLLGNSGIEKRHFALPEIDRVFNLSADELHQGFQRHAPQLATEAVKRALEQPGISASQLDALFICTCTGYLCPGLSSYVAESLDMPRQAVLQDLVGLGCGAAIPTLRAASHFLTANPDAVAAVVAVEVCSAAFYLDDDPGVLVSACLFGDGAAATLWRGRPASSSTLRCGDFQSLHVPEDREYLRFEQRQGKLRNRLHKSVPDRAAAAVSKLFQSASPTPEHIIAHAGGRDVLAALETALPGYALEESERVLAAHGNMSSPSVLFALQDRLTRVQTPEDLWLVSFGAGFSAHSCRLSPI